jgi:hypothetical protein
MAGESAGGAIPFYEVANRPFKAPRGLVIAIALLVDCGLLVNLQ